MSLPPWVWVVLYPNAITPTTTCEALDTSLEPAKWSIQRGTLGVEGTGLSSATFQRAEWHYLWLSPASSAMNPLHYLEGWQRDIWCFFFLLSRKWLYYSYYFKLEGHMCWAQFFLGSFGEYEWSSYNCSRFLKSKRHFPSAGSVTKLQMSFLFVSPTCTDQIMKLRHTQSPRPLLLCRSARAISQFDTWHKLVLNGVSAFCLFSWNKKALRQHTGTSRGKQRENAAGRGWAWCCCFPLPWLSEQQRSCCI